MTEAYIENAAIILIERQGDGAAKVRTFRSREELLKGVGASGEGVDDNHARETCEHEAVHGGKEPCYSCEPDFGVDNWEAKVVEPEDYACTTCEHEAVCARQKPHVTCRPHDGVGGWEAKKS